MSTAMASTVVELRPGEMGPAGRISQVDAEALGGRVMAAAAEVARCEAVFIELLGEFDAADGFGWFDGITSTSHWVSWACGVAPGTAREHVRVARALRRMPATQRAFAAGELSYSKVRELTRLVDECEEADVLELARLMTASQLARTVQAFRGCPGVQPDREDREKVSWSHDEHGMVRISAVLCPEQGQAVIQALQAASEANLPDEGSPEHPRSDAEPTLPSSEQERPDQVSGRSRVDGLIEVATTYLESLPEDRSGEDRHLVVIDVNVDQLTGLIDAGDVPAGTRDASDVPAGTPTPSDVPAGTREASVTIADPVGGAAAVAAAARLRLGECAVRGGPALEPETARRLCCDAMVAAILTDGTGEPLAMGRQVRLGTRAQRRALLKRDKHCQYPGCDRTRRLKIHHIIHWLDGGPTDLSNLMLVCQRHHTRVHETGVQIVACPDRDHCPVRWHFLAADGNEILPEGAPEVPLQQRALPIQQQFAHVTSTSDPAAQRIFPEFGGAGFDLHNCVEVLFGLRRAA